MMEDANAERGSDLLEGHSFHDVSESIPEDDEDYSSTDGTYYSDEVEAIMNQNGCDHKDDDDETTDDWFANDDDGFHADNDSFPAKNTGSDFEFGNFASLESQDRSQNSVESKGHHENDQEDDSYTESDDESKATNSSSELSGNRLEEHPDSDGSSASSEFKTSNSECSFTGSKEGGEFSEGQTDVLGNITMSETRERSHSPNSRERLVSDSDASVDSDENDSASESSSSVEIATTSDNQKNLSMETGDLKSTSYQISSEWGHFDNLNERQPTFINRDDFPSNDDSAFQSKMEGEETDEKFPSAFGDNPFGGDPFSMGAAEEALRTNEPIIADSHSFDNTTQNEHMEDSGLGNNDDCRENIFSSFARDVSVIKGDVNSDSGGDDDDNDDNKERVALEENAQLNDFFPPNGSVSKSGIKGLSAIDNSQVQDDFVLNGSANSESGEQVSSGESERSFSESSSKNDSLDNDETEGDDTSEENGDRASRLSISSSGNNSEYSDNCVPSHQSLDESEVSSLSNLEKEHADFEKDTSWDSPNDTEGEEGPFKSSRSSRSSGSSIGGDQTSKDVLSSDSVSQEIAESSSSTSNIDAMEPSNEDDCSWQGKEESSSSYLENDDFGEGSKNDDQSDSDPLYRGSHSSKDGISGGCSDSFSSRSLNEDAVGVSSSSVENSDSNAKVDKNVELFHASFSNESEQSALMDTSNTRDKLAKATFENDSLLESKSPIEEANKSPDHFIVETDNEPSDLIIDRTGTPSDDSSNNQNNPLPTFSRDMTDDSENSVSSGSSSEYSSPKSLGDNVDESKMDESFNSESDENDLLEEKTPEDYDKKSTVSSSTSTGHSGLRSVKDDADSSWNSDSDPSARSGSDSSFHDSELSKSLRLEAHESPNLFHDNSEHSQTASLHAGVEESLNPNFDNNDISEGSSLEEEEVVDSHKDSSFFDDSEYSTSISGKGGDNASCSTSASGFDSSEFSRSLRLEAKELVDSSSEQSVGQSSNSKDERPKDFRVESTESSDELKNGSSDAEYDTSELSQSEPIREIANESRSFSVDSSDHHTSKSGGNEGYGTESLADETNESHWSSSFDSHKDFRARSRKKCTVDESFNSAFDVSRSESLGDRTSGSWDRTSASSLPPFFQYYKGPLSKPIQEEPDQEFQASTESSASEDQSKNSNHGEVKNDRNDSSSSTHSADKIEINTGYDKDPSSSNINSREKLGKGNDSACNEATENSEVSMMIGDVFGQPNELIESRLSQASGLADQKPDVGDNHLRGTKDKVENEGTKQNENAKRNKATKGISEKERKRRKRRRKERRRRKKEAKSVALLEFAANVNEAILDLESRSETKQNINSSANSLLHGFDALMGIFLQLSDEVELIATFAGLNTKDEGSGAHVSALTAILEFAETFDQLFSDLKPIISEAVVGEEEEEADEYMEDIFDRLDALVDLICEITHRVGERQEWNCRAETTFVTLLELIERDTLDLRCYYDDVTTPDPGISANVHEAWSATGHIEELKALQRCNDPRIFRQICYEVMVSTDHWCPDSNVLMEICDIDPAILKEEPKEYMDDGDLAPVPQAAEHVLEKVNGETLRRLDVFASVLRRILPPHAVSDASLRSRFTSNRNAIDSPLGLSATNVVSISSAPESINNPDALGVAGVGKTTLAAMVAEHRDVRRHYIDGVAWVYLGDQELNYSRYTQCLRELVAQLDFYDGIPLFAELLHTPGENPSKRKRREEGFMIYARDTIAGLLENRSVLIILDDVCFEPDMDWFDFAPMPDESTDSQGNNCALVITTRRRSLLPAADTVEIDMLDEADAITLLIQESGQLSRTLMAESKEARSVVRECANHPLAVKSIGRWLNLKHATAGVGSSVEEIHMEVIKSMDKILKTGDNSGTDMMYEILSTSLSPAINGGPTNIIKFCFAAFIMVFCDRKHISEFELSEPTPIIPMSIAELLFQTLLEMYEVSLLKKGSLFYAQKKEAAVLIPEALSALGVLKVITYSDTEDEENSDDEQKFLQVMHSIHHEYGVYLANDDRSLKDFTKDAERQWNRALVDAYLSRVREWDWDLDDAAHCYALEMIVSHMIRGKMYSAASNLLTEKSFIRGRLKSLGRENCTKRYIKDCELLFERLKERVPGDPKLRATGVMKRAYQALGRQLTINVEKHTQDARVKNVEVARAHYEIGFSLAENRCWDAAIAHWETSQELLSLALGPVEVVAGILFNIGVVYSELNEYEQSLTRLKECLKIRATVHGEEHVLYAQTIQKIGDVLLDMSDYNEAMESYNWALDVMYREPDHHYIEIGEILDNKGKIHYSKGEVDEALQCHQEALRSKQQDLGEDHPELAETFQHIGNCLSDEGNIEDAIVHFEESVRLKELDPEGGPENDADILTIEGILNNLEGDQKQGLECYERALQILVTDVRYRKEKIASLLHLIGCVYLMSGEQNKAMKLFKESLKARRKVLGFIHLDVASTLFNMAFLHQTRNRFDKALRCLEEALKIRQLRLPESEKVAVTHEKIGSLARGMGKAKKAQIAFEEALKIRKSIHGQQHEAVATVLQELGDLMDDLGEYESAMGFYVDALEIRRSRLGPDDIAVAETLYSMGYTLHNNQEPDRALACFVEALSIRRYQIGDDSMEVGDTLNMMGFLKAKRGELDDALTLLWDALRIRKLQDDHIKVSETLKNIGNVHREKEELELALECYEESLRIRRFELGHDHEKVADVLLAIGNVYSENPLHIQQAKQAYEEALEIRVRVFGERDESVAVVLRYMGKIEYRANNLNKARTLLTRFVEIRRDNGTNNNEDYVSALLMLGNIQKEKVNETEARVYWNEAYQVFQRFGTAETNTKLAAAMQHLVEEDKIDIIQNKTELSQNNKTKSLFGKVTEILVKKEKSDDDSLYQNGRKAMRRKGRGFKL